MKGFISDGSRKSALIPVSASKEDRESGDNEMVNIFLFRGGQVVKVDNCS